MQNNLSITKPTSVQRHYASSASKTKLWLCKQSQLSTRTHITMIEISLRLQRNPGTIQRNQSATHTEQPSNSQSTESTSLNASTTFHHLVAKTAVTKVFLTTKVTKKTIAVFVSCTTSLQTLHFIAS